MIKGDSGAHCIDMCRSYKDYPKKWCKINTTTKYTEWTWDTCTFPGYKIAISKLINDPTKYVLFI